MDENISESRMDASPLKDTLDSLSKTGHGQILYDRKVLSPILPAFDNSSGVLIPECVFNRRKTSLLLDRSFQDKPTLQAIQQTSLLVASNNGNNLNSLTKWQTEMMLRRSPNEDITPVFSLSHHMIMQLFEAREKEQGTNVASSFKKKIEDFEQSSRQAAEEDCSRMKRELEQRLVPTSEIDLERDMRRMQEEAQMKSKIEADRLEKKLRDFQSQQEREQQMIKDELRRQLLAQQMAEATQRKAVCVEKVEASWRKFQESLNTCLARDTSLANMQSKLNKIQAIKTQCDSFNLSGQDPLAIVTQCEATAKQLEELVNSISPEIEAHNKSVRENEARLIAIKQEQPPASVLQPDQQKKAPTQDSSSNEDTSDLVFKDDFNFYTQLQSELLKYEANSAAFVSDPNLKSLRFDLQKAIIAPINEISDQSGQHLQEKLDRIRNLLLGNLVDVGPKRIRATQHSAGLPYCLNVLARKIVQQGEDQVNVNPKAAFPIAAVATELWVEFPEFGRLLLAHFYKQCSYLVPYYVPQQEGQSDEDYYRSLGYKYSNGKVEQQPAYLKRMTGVVRLFAAIMISTPRRNQPHPYGLNEAWRYLSALLNLPPRNEITAGVLEVFLSVVGNAMTKEFGQQFKKILHFICTEYLPMIHRVTPAGSGGGPAFRLENFLQDSIKAGGIAPPSGQLPPRFW